MKPPAAKRPALLLRRMYATLAETYGPQYWWPGETQLEIVVGAYLTQNTSWRAVELSIANLKAHELLTLDGLRHVSEEHLRAFIRPSGFMQRKALAIKAFVAFLDEAYSGSFARFAASDTFTARKQLLALPGVGPETADAILLYALGHPVMVVDEYLRRIATRHTLIETKATYSQIQQLAIDAFAAEDDSTRVQHYNEFHAVVVALGKRHCKREPQCQDCPLFKPDFDPPAKTHHREAARK